MNLEESDSFKSKLEKDAKKKRLVIASIILCALLIVFLFAMIIAIKHQDSITEKFFVDGVQIPKPKNLYTDVEGTLYVDVQEFINLLNSSSKTTISYDYQNGHYGLYDEDEESCLIDNGYETIALSSNNKFYHKYINKSVPSNPIIAGIDVSIKSDYGYYEKFNIENPIRYINEKIYVPFDNIQEMFNVRIDWGEYRKRIYSFENIVATAQEQVLKMPDGRIMSGYYENLKALLYGYVVLQDAAESQYGVYSLADGTDKLSSQYQDILFVQNVQEFYTTVENGTMGLISADGKNIIKPSKYNKISLLDDDNQLYEVEENEEVGVINRKGEVTIHPENDSIGIDVSKFKLENIENNKLLGGKYIPVKNNKKYGLFNTEGEEKLSMSYDGLGYISTTTSNKSGEEESVLMIPNTEGVNGIIINQGDLYGIFDIDEGEIFLPCSFSKIFAIKKGGKITYYIEFNGEQNELKSYLEGLGIAKNFDMIEKSEENADNEDNDVTNESVDENTNTIDEQSPEDPNTVVITEE